MGDGGGIDVQRADLCPLHPVHAQPLVVTEVVACTPRATIFDSPHLPLRRYLDQPAPQELLAKESVCTRA
jgi:hypothetical protein